MFGYIRVFDGELKIKEYNLYKSAYCRLCRNIGFFSQIARMFLSYDMTFFALVIDENCYAGCIDCTLPKCHKLGGKCKKACTDQTYSFTAALSIALTYEKLLDDIRDGKKSALILRFLISKAYKKVSLAFPDMTDSLHRSMVDYYSTEDTKPDAICLAEEFGNVLSNAALSAQCIDDVEMKNIYALFFNYIGAVVYLIDSIDDIEKDIKSGNYNPIIQFHESITSIHEKALIYLSKAEQLIAALPYRDTIPIIENVIHYGLPYQINKAIHKEE